MNLTPYEVAVLKTEIAEINKALELANGDKGGAAKILHLDRKTVYNKLNKYKRWMQSQPQGTIIKAEAPQ